MVVDTSGILIKPPSTAPPTEDQLAALEQRKGDLAAEVNARIEELARARASLQDAQARSNTTRGPLAAAVKETAEWRAQLAQASALLGAARVEANAVSEDRASMDGEVVALQQRLASARMQRGGILTFQKAVAEVLAPKLLEVTWVDDAQAVGQQRAELLSVKRDSLIAQTSNLLSEEQRFLERARGIESQLHELNAQYEEVKLTMEAANQEHATMLAQVDRFQGRHRELSSEIDAVKASNTSLEGEYLKLGQALEMGHNNNRHIHAAVFQELHEAQERRFKTKRVPEIAVEGNDLAQSQPASRRAGAVAATLAPKRRHGRPSESSSVTLAAMSAPTLQTRRPLLCPPALTAEDAFSVPTGHHMASATCPNTTSKDFFNSPISTPSTQMPQHSLASTSSSLSPWRHEVSTPGSIGGLGTP